MVWLNLLPLLFGILTPYSLITSALHAFAAGLILRNITASAKHQAILIILYMAILALKWQAGFAIISGVGLILAVILASKFSQVQNHIAQLTITVIIINLFTSVYFDGRELRAQLDVVPAPAYQTDMTAYLKTYYLLEQGESYYQAFAATIPGRLNGAFPGEIWGWKQPLIFYIWSFLTGSGQGIAYLAAGLFAITLTAGYQIIRKITSSHVSLLSVYLLFPYLHYPLVEMTVIQVEWWALCFLILGIWAMQTNRYLLTGSLFAISLAIRELFAIPMAAIWLIVVLKKDFRSAIAIAAPILLAFFPYFIFIHLNNILKYEGPHVLDSLARSQSASGWHLVRTTLAYNAWSYALGQFKLFHLLLVITTAGLTIRIYKHHQTSSTLILLASYLVFFILSFKLKMMDTWHDYWGIYYLPLLLIAVPVGIESFKRFKS